jgi:outer membrane receptor protein involved in Fe transport
LPSLLIDLAFLDHHAAKKLYVSNPESIKFMGETLFKTVIDFSDTIPSGTYTAEIYLLSDGEVVGMQSTPITVEKSGLDAFVYNFGILYQLNKNQNIYAALNTGYRAPNIDDMGSLGIVDFRYELPTANLKPEQSINTELGYRYQSEKIKTELLVFYNQLNNLISRVKQPGQVINGYDVYAKKNSQFAFIRGAEFSIDYAIHKQIHFMHQISYTYGQNITLNEPMRRIPPINGNVALQWNRNSHYIHFVAQFAGKQSRLAAADKSDNRIDKNGTPAWQIYHLNFGKSFQHFDINAGVHNILNQDYRTHGSGINGMGRNIWAAIVVKL